MNRLYNLMGIHFERPLTWRDKLTLLYFPLVMLALLLAATDQAPLWLQLAAAANACAWRHALAKLPEPVLEDN